MMQYIKHLRLEIDEKLWPESYPYISVSSTGIVLFSTTPPVLTREWVNQTKHRIGYYKHKWDSTEKLFYPYTIRSHKDSFSLYFTRDQVLSVDLLECKAVQQKETEEKELCSKEEDRENIKIVLFVIIVIGIILLNKYMLHWV